MLRHAFEVARRDWKLPIAENPFALVARLKRCPGRTRRLQAGEWERLQQAYADCRNPFILPLVELALETGMRRGEILQARWKHVSVDSCTLYLPITKNGNAPTVPLSSRALAVLARLKSMAISADDRLTPITIDTLKMAWKRAIRRAGLEDLRLHDLRHEAVSRFFERGLAFQRLL